jgi:hypothetical protein
MLHTHTHTHTNTHTPHMLGGITKSTSMTVYIDTEFCNEIRVIFFNFPPESLL